jgi:high affinity Mn2+ porin
MGNYKNAILQADTNIPDITTTRAIGNTKVGIGLNIDQELQDNVGVFMRFGINDGNNETWCFTEADRTLSVGMLLNGAEWKREGDNLGLAFVFNSLSADHKNYLQAGGMGFQLGDGQLAYGTESAAEVFYSYKISNKGLWLTGDYQLILNPGYNKDRGPVNVFSFRLHVEL